MNSLAYADDILLISSTTWGMQTALDLVEKETGNYGLVFNPRKCSVLSVVPAGKQKKIKIPSTPTFRLRELRSAVDINVRVAISGS